MLAVRYNLASSNPNWPDSKKRTKGSSHIDFSDYLAVDGVPEVLLGHPHQAGAHEENHGGAVVQLKTARTTITLQLQGSRVEWFSFFAIFENGHIAINGNIFMSSIPKNRQICQARAAKFSFSKHDKDLKKFCSHICRNLP